MKTQIFSMCMGALCLFSAQGFAQDASFRISGKLDNISPMPAKMYLKSFVKGLLKPDADTAIVQNGQYTFQGMMKVDEAVVVTVSSDLKESQTNSYSLYLDKGDLIVESKGTIKNIMVSGSGATAQREHEAIINGIEQEKEDLLRIVKTDDYKNNRQLQLDVLKRSRALGGKGLFDMYTFVKQQPEKRSAPFTAYALIASGLISQTGQDTILQSLPVHVKDDALGREIVNVQLRRDSMMKAALAKKQVEAGKVPIGTKAPDFTQYDVKNNPVSLSSFKGKYVLVDFWASWCMPCRAENPNVVKAYNKYKDKGFTVLGVSLDSQTARAAWLKAIATDGLTWTQVSDLKGWKNEAAAQYGVSSIPQNFLIDPNGVVVAKNLRGEDLNSKLASIFK